MNTVAIAATQMTCSAETEENVATAERLIRDAALKGANIVLIQELFQNQYFCQEENLEHFILAKPFEDNAVLTHFGALAKELNVVLPISFFEKAHNARFNSLAIIDADGECLGVYRKSHIPHGFGYQEKFYFNPGDTGFKVWDTAVGRIGCGICWDQWFPECARSMVLQGADILLYPTAIGSETSGSMSSSMRKWQRAMQGHAASNTVIVVASNRIGQENFGDTHIDFYGASFIADQGGELVAEADQETEGVITATFDMDAVRQERAGWGFFRDRRPELYADIMALDAG
jgi:N-carbamoylputrescine amidase